MEISSLRIKTENGEETVSSLTLIENLGIKGDKKANGGDRQLTLADESSLLSYREKGEGLCINRFMPNVATKGLNFSTLYEGQKFQLGDTIIEISSTVKKCFEDCELVKKGCICDIKKNCAFARIIKGGEIHLGDEIVEI